MGVTRRRIAATLLGLLVFSFSWFFRFNNPEGSFAGLTDDHFFYLIRGWQILYGDLPVRDFVDQGAPAYYYVAAAVQVVFGRGTLSEFTFSVTVLALAATLTFWLCVRASGSLLLGLVGAAFEILLAPRMYNYPKILVYTAAIPLLWWFADRPRAWPRFCLALVTVVGFLFRHDHGVFIALACGALLLVHDQIGWRDRVRHGLIYAALVCALLGPYLAFVEMHGGVRAYLEQTAAWAARDREREPVVWPGLFDYPQGRSGDAENGALPVRAVAAVRDNAVAYLYYFELALPLLAAAVLTASRSATRPSWPGGSSKMAVVIVLAAVLDAGFLRSSLEARLADPSVPHAILIAWLGAALPALWWRRAAWRPALDRWRRPIGVALFVVAVPLALVWGIATTANLYDRLDNVAMAERPAKALEQAGRVVTRLRSEWQLSAWVDRPDRPDLLNLAMYLDACTPRDARVFVQPYIPQVLALARRGFAGGHGDLRPGFFNTVAAQELTIERLRQRSVPVALLESEESYRNFRASFPLIAGYLDQYYQLVGTHTFDGRFGIQLFARKDAVSAYRYAPLDWPCYP